MAGMSQDEIEAWFSRHFPEFERRFLLEAAEPGRARLRLRVAETHLRPGGTVSGPSMMMLADAAVYAALLAMDEDASEAVTSNFNIAFLHRPSAEDVVADARLLKVGRRLVVADVRLRSQDLKEMLAQATITYARS